MKKICLAFLLCFPGSTVLMAQNLLPSIGLAALPADSEAICYAPWYLGGFAQTGLQEGDTAADFTLYDLNGNAVNLASELAQKPVLLVAASWTCPVFRAKIPVINDIAANYGNDVTTLVIYELEAHPVVDTSAYFGYVNPGSQNLNAGITYRQPTTYGERKAIAQDMLDSLPISAPVLMDGPCNEFWAHYGPAPNNAYLIDTNGIVFAKHPWFDKFPEDIYCDLDSLLGNPGACATAATGTFAWTLDGPNIVYGSPGTTLAAHGWLINNSSTDAEILMAKNQEILPAGWASSMCVDVCYPSTTDSATILLPAGDSAWYTMYFYTDQGADTGRVQMHFRNVNVPGNGTAQWFGGITGISTGLGQQVARERLQVWPQPGHEAVQLAWEGPMGLDAQIQMTLVDGRGKVVRTLALDAAGRGRMERDGLPAGIWFYVLESGEQVLDRGKMIWRD
jgi:hypothetical protein